MMRAQDSFSESLAELFMDIAYYFERFAGSGPVKAFFALLGTVFIEMFGADTTILWIYAGFFLATIVTGSLRAAVSPVEKWDHRQVYRWTKKLLSHILIVFMIGWLAHALFRTTGSLFTAVNYVVLLLIFSEAALVYNNLKVMGLSIPLFDKVMDMLRRKAAVTVAEVFDDPSASKELEDLMKSPEDEDGEKPDE